jgi:hypothetical protein
MKHPIQKLEILRKNIHKITMYLLFYMGVKLGLSSLEEEYRLTVSETTVLRRIFGPTRQEVKGCFNSHIPRGCICCTLHQILLR